MLNFNISKVIFSKTTNYLPLSFFQLVKGTAKASDVDLSNLNTLTGTKGTISILSFFYGSPPGGQGSRSPGEEEEGGIEEVRREDG